MNMDYTDGLSTAGLDKLQINYVIQKKIGKGSFGQALLVSSRANNRRYVAKIVDTAAMSDREKRDLQNEIRILAGVRHPNIVRYREHFVDGTFVVIIMDYADGGDLHTRIKEAQRQNPPALFDPNCVIFWFLQLCMALQYLHENRILHRDIKTANVFLTRHNVVKLGDFGISTVLQSTMACAKTVCGTPYYFSPELCQNRPYNNKSDIWSLGVVLYEALTLQRPFNAKTLKELVKKILQGQYETVPSSVPPEVRGLCASLLQVNPLYRPSIHQILETSYVQRKLQEFSTTLAEESAKERLRQEKTLQHQKQRQKEQQKQQQQAESTSTPRKQSHDGTAATRSNNTTNVSDASTRSSCIVNEKEQLVKLRGMNRQHLRELLAQQAAKEEAHATATTQQHHPQPALGCDGAKGNNVDIHVQSGEVSTTDNDVDEMIVQNEEMLKQAKHLVGNNYSSREPDNFGEDDSASTRTTAHGTQDAVYTETAVMPDGRVIPMTQVRTILDKVIGRALLTRCVEYTNQNMIADVPNTQIQDGLNKLLSAKYACYSNAITKLTLWETKMTANDIDT